MCVCVCVGLCLTENETERGRVKKTLVSVQLPTASCEGQQRYSSMCLHVRKALVCVSTVWCPGKLHMTGMFDTAASHRPTMQTRERASIRKRERERERESEGERERK